MNDPYEPYHPDTRADMHEVAASISKKLSPYNADIDVAHDEAVANISRFAANHLSPADKDLIARQNFWRAQSPIAKLIWVAKNKKLRPY